MKVELLELSGFRSALEALRLPYSLPPRSELDGFCGITTDGVLCYEASAMIDKNDLSLMSTLVKRGDEHAKVLRGINVYLKITAPVYYWCEMEQYNIGRYRLSSESTMHSEAKGLSGDELIKVKAEIPMGRELTKIDVFNYQCLRHIYQQRKNHRLPEWREFCEFIKTLPFAKELITIGL